MVRIPPGNFLVPARGAIIKDLGVWKTRRGQPVFQKMPPKQPVPRTFAEKVNRDTFAYSAQVAPLMDAYQQQFARELAKITQLLPRDFLFIALFGRVGTFVRSDGTKIYSMAAMQDVSVTLDAIAQLKGQIMVRGETWWEGVPSGAPGQVLKVQPDGSIAWSDGGGSGGAQWWMEQPPLVPTTNSGIFGGNAFAAMPFYVEEATEVTGCRIWLNVIGTGHTGFAGAYSANPSTNGLQGGALLGQGTPQALVLGLNDFPFSSPVIFPAHTWVWAGPAILGAGNINTMAGMSSRSNAFFGQTTSTLPSTAGAASNGAGTNVTWWFY